MNSDVTNSEGILYPSKLRGTKRLILDNIGSGFHEVQEDLNYLIGSSSLMKLCDECGIVTDQILSEIAPLVIDADKICQTLHTRIQQLVLTSVRGSIHLAIDWMEHRLGEDHASSSQKIPDSEG